MKHFSVALAAEECSAPLLELDLDWEPLREVFGHFPNLEKITVANLPGSLWYFSNEEIEEIRKNLPELVERGMLQVGYIF